MQQVQIPAERLNKLAQEAVTTVFESMVGATVKPLKSANLIGDAGADMLKQLPLDGGIFSVVVNWVGDATGKMMVVLPYAAAEKFTLTLFEAESLDWLEGHNDEILEDTLGELGNMMVGLVKGGLTKWYPKLMLTTPKVLKNKRMKVDTNKMSFRRQYLFEGFGSKLLVDFCCE